MLALTLTGLALATATPPMPQVEVLDERCEPVHTVQAGAPVLIAHQLVALGCAPGAPAPG